VIGTIEGLEDRDAAEALTGARIEVDPATLPKPAKGEYYVWQVVGLPVVCDGAVVGSVHEVHGTAGGDVFEVSTATGSVFVPSIRQYVVRVDVAEGIVELVTGALDACEA
jgi:16S rRNA processing protein RimM